MHFNAHCIKLAAVHFHTVCRPWPQNYAAILLAYEVHTHAGAYASQPQ